MYKKILLLILGLVLILSGCGMFNQSTTPRTNVYIVDPYGNNLMVDGKINGNTIKTDAKGVYVEAAIESAEVQLVEPLGIFKVKDISVDPKKSVTIILEKSTNKGIKLLRTADGKLMFYDRLRRYSLLPSVAKRSTGRQCNGWIEQQPDVACR